MSLKAYAVTFDGLIKIVEANGHKINDDELYNGYTAFLIVAEEVTTWTYRETRCAHISSAKPALLICRKLRHLFFLFQ
jgi:hypothetical protein